MKKFFEAFEKKAFSFSELLPSAARRAPAPPPPPQPSNVTSTSSPPPDTGFRRTSVMGVRG